MRVSADVQGIATMNERSRGLRLAGEVMRYVLSGNGILTYDAGLRFSRSVGNDEIAFFFC